MPRMVKTVEPVKALGRGQRGNQLRTTRDRIFTARWSDMVAYLATKFRLSRDDVSRLLYAAFDYVKDETLKSDETFFIPHFGVFRRVVVQHGRQTPTGGVTQPRVRFKFRETTQWRKEE